VAGQLRVIRPECDTCFSANTNDSNGAEMWIRLEGNHSPEAKDLRLWPAGRGGDWRWFVVPAPRLGYISSRDEAYPALAACDAGALRVMAG
jgi:hypothetical protein